jgi:hypothetical protein
VRIVSFRWAVDKQLRDAVCDFAGDSRHANPRPPTSTAKPVLADTTTHVVRILARSWLNIIWKCWTTNTAYHPGRHGALHT